MTLQCFSKSTKYISCGLDYPRVSWGNRHPATNHFSSQPNVSVQNNSRLMVKVYKVAAKHERKVPNATVAPWKYLCVFVHPQLAMLPVQALELSKWLSGCLKDVLRQGKILYTVYIPTADPPLIHHLNEMSHGCLFFLGGSTPCEVYSDKMYRLHSYYPTFSARSLKQGVIPLMMG